MVAKSIILGILLFVFDFLIFGKFMKGKLKAKMSTKELSVSKEKIRLTIPTVLFIQVFFAFLLVYTFNFGVVFRMFQKTVQDGLAFVIMIFLPMLYLLINTWLWGTKDDNSTLYVSIASWLAKFLFVGFYLGIVF